MARDTGSAALLAPDGYELLEGAGERVTEAFAALPETDLIVGMSETLVGPYGSVATPFSHHQPADRPPDRLLGWVFQNCLPRATPLCLRRGVLERLGAPASAVAPASLPTDLVLRALLLRVPVRFLPLPLVRRTVRWLLATEPPVDRGRHRAKVAARLITPATRVRTSPSCFVPWRGQARAEGTRLVAFVPDAGRVTQPRRFTSPLWQRICALGREGIRFDALCAQLLEAEGPGIPAAALAQQVLELYTQRLVELNLPTPEAGA